MSAIDEWKDQLIPKDLSLAEEVIDEQQAEIDELREKNVRLVEDNKILKIALKLDGIEDFVAELNRRSKGEDDNEFDDWTDGFEIGKTQAQDEAQFEIDELKSKIAKLEAEIEELKAWKFRFSSTI